MMFLYTEPRQKPIRSIPFVTLLSIVRKLTLMVESSRVHFTLSWSFKFPRRPNFVGFSSNPLSLLIAFHAEGNTVGNSRISLSYPAMVVYGVVFFLFPWYTRNPVISFPFFFVSEKRSRLWVSALVTCSYLIRKSSSLFSHRQDLVRLAWYIHG